MTRRRKYKNNDNNACMLQPTCSDNEGESVSPMEG